MRLLTAMPARYDSCMVELRLFFPGLSPVLPWSFFGLSRPLSYPGLTLVLHPGLTPWSLPSYSLVSPWPYPGPSLVTNPPGRPPPPSSPSSSSPSPSSQSPSSSAPTPMLSLCCLYAQPGSMDRPSQDIRNIYIQSLQSPMAGNSRFKNPRGVCVAWAGGVAVAAGALGHHWPR